MDDNEKIEVDSDEGSIAEEVWNDQEHNKVPKWTEPDLPMTTGARNIFVRGVGVGLTHIGNLNIKKFSKVRETNGLELD